MHTLMTTFEKKTVMMHIVCVFTTTEVEEALGNAAIHNGSFRAKSWLWKDYTHKMAVNGCFQSVWGNRKSIAQLRKQLAVSEENQNED